MWLMTKHGFYSVVEKRPGEFHIRARERADLDNLVARVPLPGARVIDTPEADYHHRLVVDREAVRRIMAFLADTLDYANFKSQVDILPDQRNKPYHRVWTVLAQALGAFGTRGDARYP
jgi:hypothetical protein